MPSSRRSFLKLAAGTAAAIPAAALLKHIPETEGSREFVTWATLDDRDLRKLDLAQWRDITNEAEDLLREEGVPLTSIERERDVRTRTTTFLFLGEEGGRPMTRAQITEFGMNHALV